MSTNTTVASPLTTHRSFGRIGHLGSTLGPRYIPPASLGFDAPHNREQFRVLEDAVAAQRAGMARTVAASFIRLALTDAGRLEIARAFATWRGAAQHAREVAERAVHTEWHVTEALAEARTEHAAAKEDACRSLARSLRQDQQQLVVDFQAEARRAEAAAVAAVEANMAKILKERAETHGAALQTLEAKAAEAEALAMSRLQNQLAQHQDQMEAIQSWVEDRVGQAAEAEAALASEYAARIETLEKAVARAYADGVATGEAAAAAAAAAAAEEKTLVARVHNEAIVTLRRENREATAVTTEDGARDKPTGLKVATATPMKEPEKSQVSPVSASEVEMIFSADQYYDSSSRTTRDKQAANAAPSSLEAIQEKFTEPLFCCWTF